MLLAGCAREPTAAERTLLTMVNGQEVRAQVPPQLKSDPAAYQSFVKQIVYRTALLQRAGRERVALTPAERAAVDSTLPSKDATRDYLRRQGITYEEYAKDAYEVALIQKMERREVFDRVAVDPSELTKAYAADANGPRGPRTFLTAIALPGGCAKSGQAARLAEVLRAAVLPANGHRLDVTRLAREAGLDASQAWSLDLHLNEKGRLAALVSYDRSRDAGGPTVGPSLFAALWAWSTRASLLDVFPPACIDGSLWVARQVAQAEDRRLRFDEASDELEAPLLAGRQKTAFDTYVDSVLAQAKVEGRP